VLAKDAEDFAKNMFWGRKKADFLQKCCIYKLFSDFFLLTFVRV